MHSVTESRTLPCSGSTSARFMPGMFRNESRWRALLRDEGAAETPWVKEYVRAPIAEADLEGKFRTHEGVVTRDFGKEMEVVNPLPTWAGLGKAPWTKYVTKRCHKESATEVPILLTKARGQGDQREAGYTCMKCFGTEKWGKTNSRVIGNLQYCSSRLGQQMPLVARSR